MPPQAEWTADDLFRPFAQIQENVKPAREESYFDGSFYDFEGPAGSSVRWDLPLLHAVVREYSPSTVLDVGCGSGRIISSLRENRPPEALIGVDTSARALAAARTMHGQTAKFVHADVADLAAHVEPRSIDLALLGSVTINSFASGDSVRELLTVMDLVLRADGSLVVLVFAAMHLRDFARFAEFCDGVGFVDREGRDRMILRGIDFRPADRRLRHNYFIPGQPWAACAPDRGALTVHREHLWLHDELEPLVTGVGWRLRRWGSTTVAEGGADGWTCDCFILQR